MAKSNNTLRGEDGLARCWWCGDDPLYVDYHDYQWGIPTDDDRLLFEKICLEGFQAGLSWITILRKRQAFRSAFSGFDYEKVARYRVAKVDRLLTDPGIVRHRGKIESAINNARCAIELIDEFGSIARFIWGFEPTRSTVIRNREQIPSKTDESMAMSKQLKRRGWSFVGPTTCYAMMQAIGMVNDHLRSCHAWSKVDQARRQFRRPGSSD